MNKFLRTMLPLVTFITAIGLLVISFAGVLYGVIHLAAIITFGAIVLFANFYERKNNG